MSACRRAVDHTHCTPTTVMMMMTMMLMKCNKKLKISIHTHTNTWLSSFVVVSCWAISNEVEKTINVIPIKFLSTLQNCYSIISTENLLSWVCLVGPKFSCLIILGKKHFLTKFDLVQISITFIFSPKKSMFSYVYVCLQKFQVCQKKTSRGEIALIDIH